MLNNARNCRISGLFPELAAVVSRGLSLSDLPQTSNLILEGQFSLTDDGGYSPTITDLHNSPSQLTAKGGYHRATAYQLCCHIRAMLIITQAPYYLHASGQISDEDLFSM